MSIRGRFIFTLFILSVVFLHACPGQELSKANGGEKTPGNDQKDETVKGAFADQPSSKKLANAGGRLPKKNDEEMKATKKNNENSKKITDKNDENKKYKLLEKGKITKRDGKVEEDYKQKKEVVKKSSPQYKVEPTPEEEALRERLAGPDAMKVEFIRAKKSLNSPTTSYSPTPSYSPTTSYAAQHGSTVCIEVRPKDQKQPPFSICQPAGSYSPGYTVHSSVAYPITGATQLGYGTAHQGYGTTQEGYVATPVTSHQSYGTASYASHHDPPTYGGGHSDLHPLVVLGSHSPTTAAAYSLHGLAHPSYQRQDDLEMVDEQPNIVIASEPIDTSFLPMSRTSYGSYGATPAHAIPITSHTPYSTYPSSGSYPLTTPHLSSLPLSLACQLYKPQVSQLYQPQMSPVHVIHPTSPTALLQLFLNAKHPASSPQYGSYKESESSGKSEGNVTDEGAVSAENGSTNVTAMMPKEDIEEPCNSMRLAEVEEKDTCPEHVIQKKLRQQEQQLLQEQLRMRAAQQEHFEQWLRANQVYADFQQRQNEHLLMLRAKEQEIERARATESAKNSGDATSDQISLSIPTKTCGKMRENEDQEPLTLMGNATHTWNTTHMWNATHMWNSTHLWNVTSAGDVSQGNATTHSEVTPSAISSQQKSSSENELEQRGTTTSSNESSPSDAQSQGKAAETSKDTGKGPNIVSDPDNSTPQSGSSKLTPKSETFTSTFHPNTHFGQPMLIAHSVQPSLTISTTHHHII